MSKAEPSHGSATDLTARALAVSFGLVAMLMLGLSMGLLAIVLKALVG